MIPVLIHDAFNKYVEVIYLLFRYLLNSHINWIDISDFQLLSFYIIHCDVVEIHLITVRAEWYVLEADNVFLFFPSTDKSPIEDTDCYGDQSIVHYY